MAEAFFNAGFAPFVLDHLSSVFLRYRLSKFDEALGRIGPPIQQYVFDQFEQLFWDFRVNPQQSGIHDSHIQSRLDRMIQKRAVHRFPDEVVATERK